VVLALPDFDPEPWRLRAACRGAGPAPFFDSVDGLALCRSCPVRDDCDRYATLHGIRHGVWGGRYRGTVRIKPKREPVVKPEHACAVCGDVLTATTYCGDACKARASRRRRAV
jgi:hypothetical protein